MSLDTTRTYSYGKQAVSRTYQASPMHPAVRGVMDRINAEYGTAYNVCVLNYYKDQHQHLGWHADDSPEQDLTHPIAVVSFGAERFIYVKEKSFKGETPESDRHLLTRGSLFVMPGGYQDNHFHKIPKHDRECGGRISFTFRKLDR
jgi:alkylated DNA repair dioxygenase AlkB